MNISNSQNEETLYFLLNVKENASADEIKKAYRKLSLELHPDRNKGNTEKLEQFKKITTAYNTLSNENERAEYDCTLNFNKLNIPDNIFMNMLFNPIDINSIFKNMKNMKNMKDSEKNTNSFHMPNIPIDILSKLASNSNFSQDFNNFNNFNNVNFDSKPKTIYKSISISLFDAYKGCKLPVNIERTICENNIQYEQEETIYVEISKGIDNNEIITIKEKGNKSNNAKGDIEIKILINNDTPFERNGIDLIYKKTITLKESLCGFSFELKYLDGREFRINNECGNLIPPDFRKTIPKFGIERDNSTGDLIIIFDVKYPKTLSLEQLNHLNDIL